MELFARGYSFSADRVNADRRCVWTRIGAWMKGEACKRLNPSRGVHMRELRRDEQISEEFSDAHLLQIRLSGVLGRFGKVAKIVPRLWPVVIPVISSPSSDTALTATIVMLPDIYSDISRSQLKSLRIVLNAKSRCAIYRQIRSKDREREMKRHEKKLRAGY